MEVLPVTGFCERQQEIRVSDDQPRCSGAKQPGAKFGKHFHRTGGVVRRIQRHIDGA